MKYKVDNFKLGIDELQILYYQQEWKESNEEIIDAQIFYDYLEQKVEFHHNPTNDPADICLVPAKENLVFFNSLPILEQNSIVEQFLNTIRK